MKTVVGLYEDIADAQAAINELVRSGFDRADISLIASDRWTNTRDSATSVDDAMSSDAADTVTDIDVDGDAPGDASQLGNDIAAGLAAGGVMGGLGGVLLGIGALAIPGIGPVVAAGPIIAGLTGAGIGAAVGGLVGALVNWGIPPESADLYAESVRRGNILVGLKADESQVERAADIMNRHAPIDVERRSEYWRSTGWTGYDKSATAWTEEEVAADRMRYSDYLDYSTYTPAFREHYEMTYGRGARDYTWYDPAYRYGYELANDDRYADYSTWDELENEARRGWEETQNAAERGWNEFKAAVRRGWEEVRDAADLDSGFSDFDSTFRGHYEERYRGGLRDYDWYAPAYRYGYNAGLDMRYDQYPTWNDRLESDIRRRWEAGDHAADSAWDDVKDAIRQGWISVREAFDVDEEDERYATGAYDDR